MGCLYHGGCRVFLMVHSWNWVNWQKSDGTLIRATVLFRCSRQWKLCYPDNMIKALSNTIKYCKSICHLVFSCLFSRSSADITATLLQLSSVVTSRGVCTSHCMDSGLSMSVLTDNCAAAATMKSGELFKKTNSWKIQAYFQSVTLKICHAEKSVIKKEKGIAALNDTFIAVGSDCIDV